jgi:hypothetical protein
LLQSIQNYPAHFYLRLSEFMTLYKKYLIPVAVLVYIIFFSLFAYRISRSTSAGGDFHVFWQAGTDFVNGKDLYFPEPGSLPFIYPQFAAFLFQVLALFQLPDAGMFFYLLNVFLFIPVCVWMTYRICINYGIEERKSAVATGAAFILSAQYIWSNLTMFQVNYLLLTFTMSGIYFLSKDRPEKAVIFFTIATFFKIVPVFFLVFTLLKYRSFKLYVYSFAAAVFCLILPAAERGLDRTILDYQHYYEVFLKEFKNGKVLAAPASHTLKAGILKMFYPETRDEVFNKDNYKSALGIANWVLLAMFIMLTAALVWNMKTEKKISMLFLADIFIFSHLASGMTWTHHMVTATFSLLPFVLLGYQNLKGGHRILYYSGIAVLVFMAVEGSDTTGKVLYRFVRYYDIYVIVPFLLFFYYLWLQFRNFKKHQAEGSKTAL